MQNEINIRLIFFFDIYGNRIFSVDIGKCHQNSRHTAEPKTEDESGNIPEVIEILENFIAAIGGRKVTSYLKNSFLTK